MRLLDVATGTGLAAQAALDLGVSPDQLVGLDPSRECSKKIRSAAESPWCKVEARLSVPERQLRLHLHGLRVAARRDLGVCFPSFIGC
jgi:hypothetical protein